jgi:hypothetical protein
MVEEVHVACVGGEVAVDLRSKLQTKVLPELKQKWKGGTKRRLGKGYLSGGGVEEGRAVLASMEVLHRKVDKSFRWELFEERDREKVINHFF